MKAGVVGQGESFLWRGLLEPAGGGMEATETPRRGLEREIRVELGSRIVIDDLLGICPSFHRIRRGVVSIYLVYTGEPTT